MPLGKLAKVDPVGKVLGDRCSMVTIGPRAYNRMYSKIRNVNKMLAWGHARAIENLLEKEPDCPRALSDKFGPTHQIERALMDNGRKIKLDQRTNKSSHGSGFSLVGLTTKNSRLTSLTKKVKNFKVYRFSGRTGLHQRSFDFSRSPGCLLFGGSLAFY